MSYVCPKCKEKRKSEWCDSCGAITDHICDTICTTRLKDLMYGDSHTMTLHIIFCDECGEIQSINEGEQLMPTDDLILEGDSLQFPSATIGNLHIHATKTEDLLEEYETTGDPDQFKIICKVTGKGWMASTKGLEIKNLGVLIETKERRANVTSMALQFVPNVRLLENPDFPNSYRIVKMEV